MKFFLYKILCTQKDGVLCAAGKSLSIGWGSRNKRKRETDTPATRLFKSETMGEQERTLSGRSHVCLGFFPLRGLCSLAIGC